jgi:hypothetical protein
MCIIVTGDLLISLDACPAVFLLNGAPCPSPRFLKMTNDRSSDRRTIIFADPPASSSRYVSVDVPVKALNEELMDTAFVKAINSDNYPGGLEAMHQDMQFGDAVPLGAHWSYKYLVDLDGMSYSARFLSFLASDSVPVKSTIYEEFFSDWIQPWYAFLALLFFLLTRGVLPGFTLSLFHLHTRRSITYMLIFLAHLMQPWKRQMRQARTSRQTRTRHHPLAIESCGG